jgi:hypothetical protein
VSDISASCGTPILSASQSQKRCEAFNLLGLTDIKHCLNRVASIEAEFLECEGKTSQDIASTKENNNMVSSAKNSLSGSSNGILSTPKKFIQRENTSPSNQALINDNAENCIPSKNNIARETKCMLHVSKETGRPTNSTPNV